MKSQVLAFVLGYSLIVGLLLALILIIAQVNTRLRHGVSICSARCLPRDFFTDRTGTFCACMTPFSRIQP